VPRIREHALEMSPELELDGSGWQVGIDEAPEVDPLE